MTVTRQQIVRSYRSLYRHALHAVQYSTPARYTLKALLENAYRTGKQEDYDQNRIDNTLLFLHGAASEKGMEHRILKNLLHTWWWETRKQRSWKEYVQHPAL